MDIWTLTLVYLFSLFALLLYSILLVWFPPATSESQTSFRVQLKRLSFPLVLFLSMAYISFLFSTNRFNSRNEIFNLLNYFFLFYLVTTIIKKKKRQNLIRLVLLVGIFLSITGIYQFIRGNVAAGTMVNPNILAGYLTMVIPFTTGLILSLSNSINREFIKSHLFYLVGWLLMVACLFLTKSPGGIIGVILGICVILYFKHGKQIFIKFRYIFIAIAVVIVILLLFKLRQLQVYNRLLCWWGALRMVYQRPLIGVGLGGFETAYARYKLTGLNPLYAYNYFLQLAAEMGVVGLGVFLWFLFMVGKHIKFLSKGFKFFSFEVGVLGSIVAILFHNLTDYNLCIPANAILFWVFLGLLITGPGFLESTRKGGNSAVPRHRLGKINKLLLTGAITFSILGVGVGLTRLSLANRHYQLGKHLFEIRKLENLVKVEGVNLEKAEFEYGRAIELDSLNSWYHHGLAGVYLARYWREGYSSYLDEAIIELREAVERMPYYGPFYANLSYVYELKKDYKKAILYMESAIACDRQNGDYWQRISELVGRMQTRIDVENN
ncbi:MAG TPA: O-antigen ligase family protein [bacterium]|nr:O-antigen ligase family protein [bacterium]